VAGNPRLGDRIEPGVREAEHRLFEHFDAAGRCGAAEVIFVLGAPRTGSTLLYQLMVHLLELAYVSNFVNDCFAETPAVGLAVQRAAEGTREAVFVSAYGKVAGAFQPSEASAVMQRWCGGGHPSQIVSAVVLPNMERHFAMTAAVASALYGRPLVVKNAWNCFRVASLARAFPKSRFIWIRRDIRQAASSDLEARYATKGSPDAWNSATPANLEALRRLPYWEQVVENQHEFNSAIRSAFDALPSDRTHTVWYEDLCEDPGSYLGKIAGFAGLGTERLGEWNSRLPRAVVRGASRLKADDRERVHAYAHAQDGRFRDEMFGGKDGSEREGAA
jgi:hypothetical protein